MSPSGGDSARPLLVPIGEETTVGTVLGRIEKPAAYELVVNQLKRAIHLGSYVPGDKLPPERALAEQLGVSRVTTREALRVLQGEGYISVGSGGTSVIQAP